MKPVAGLALVAISAAGAGGYWAGHRNLALPGLPWLQNAAPVPVSAASAPTGPVIYYRDPDGQPEYSSEPRNTSDGRDFLPVRASDEPTFDDKPVPAAEAPANGKRIRFYRNPMGLSDTSPTPKKDSMGMDYIPVFEGDGGDGKVIHVAPGKLQQTGVRSETVERRRIAQTLRAPGSVQLDERRIFIVSTRSDAFVESVMNVTTGDMVKKGQPLVKVYSPEINSAAAQMISNPGFDGSRRRLRNLNVSDDAISEIERTHSVPSAIVWSAPSNGVVLERGAVEGMKAAAGATLFRIADISVVWVLADVPEHDVGSVRLGQPAAVRVRARPGRIFSGRVGMIYPQVNRETRSTRVRIEIPNLDGALLADMYADVEIQSGTPDPAIAVPDNAVIDAGTRQTVILDNGDGRLEPREVKLGVRGDGFVEVTEGVQPGDRVVTSANFLIDAESNLKAALEGLAAAKSSDPEKPQ